MVRKLPTITYNGKKYYVDLRLEELRNVKTAKSIKFTEIRGGLDSPIKKRLRIIRFETWEQEYIHGIDD